jgi:hypothetical protein
MTKNGQIDFALSLAVCMQKYNWIYGEEKMGVGGGGRFEFLGP